MKKLIFLIVCAILGLSANAQFKFKSLNNNDGKTTIVIADYNFESGSEICCAKFNNDGKTYEAKSMLSAQEDGKMTVTLTFKKMTVFNDMSVTIKVNDRQANIPIDLAEVANQLNGYKPPLP